MTDSPLSPWQRVLSAIRRPFSWWPRVRPLQEPQDLLRDDLLDADIAAFQQGLVLEALREQGGVGGIPFDEGNEETAFLAHPGRLVCRASEVEVRLEPFFRDRQDTFAGLGETEPLFGDLVRYHLPGRTDNEPNDIVQLLDQIDENVGRGVAFPDHVLHVTPQGSGKMCPATEPELPLGSGPIPAVAHDEQAGRGVRVSVVDTGWHPDAANNAETPWLDDDVHPITGDKEAVVKGDIGPYVGHGTFVAGIIRCLAPAATLTIEGVLVHAGAVYESDIAVQLHQAMTNLKQEELPKVISISAGTYTRNNAGLLAFELLSQVYKLGLDDDGPLVVAAAGNENTNRRFYPAGFDWVVGVGALDENLTAPRFTNYGADWVDVWAHGTKLVNAFPVGTYYVKEPGPAQGEERHFTGMAQWSGTSFATPIVSGLIAAIISEDPDPRTQMTARQAKDELIENRSTKVPDQPKVSKGKAVGPPFV